MLYKQATSLIPADDDYRLLTSVCYIRLGRFKEAGDLLETILRRSPDNEKALYHLSFCKRAQGRQRDAIEDLTKVLGVIYEIAWYSRLRSQLIISASHYFTRFCDYVVLYLIMYLSPPHIRAHFFAPNVYKVFEILVPY
jgi:tetratricopeptide (TPR) repeat protein